MTREQLDEAVRIADLCCREENDAINSAASAELDTIVTEHRQELIELARWAWDNGFHGQVDRLQDAHDRRCTELLGNVMAEGTRGR